MKKSLSLWLAIVITLLVFTFQSCKHPDPAPKVQLPTIESFTPDSAPVGTTVIITGTFFSTDASKDAVSFNGTQATVTNATETQLTVTVPANATTGKITVTVNGNDATSASNFTVTTTPVNPQPTLTGFSPSSGLVGIDVTITGTNFSTTMASNVVKFNGTLATVTQATATQLKVTVPVGATTGKVSAIVNGVTLTSTTDFTVTPAPVPAPTIISFQPTSGAVNTDVIITGTNFSPTAASNVVTFNNVAATLKQAAADGKSLTVTVPATATTGKIAVTVNGVKVTSVDDFTVTVATADLYATVRVSEIDYALNTGASGKHKYYYNVNNVLTSQEDYYYGGAGFILNETTTFSYDPATGKMTSSVGASPAPSTSKVKHVYSYDANNVLVKDESYTTTTATYTLDESRNFTYLNGHINTVIIKDGNGAQLEADTYAYSSDPATSDPKVTVTYDYGETPLDVSNEVFYYGIIDPAPLTDPLDDLQMRKNYYNNTKTYSLSQGKIDKTVETSGGTTITNTYIYEAKQ